MRYLTIALSLLLVCASSPIRGQEATQPYKLEGFVVPGAIMQPTIASQPDSPLQFEDVKHVKFITTGGSGTVFRLRNRGTKPIRAYTVAELTTTGLSWDSSWPHSLTEKLLLPGETIPRQGEDSEVEIVPMTKELRAKLPEQMEALNVLMVVRVEFADGSVYSDEQTYKALQAYFKNVAFAVEEKEQRRRFHWK